jgi:DNA modification methylase
MMPNLGIINSGTRFPSAIQRFPNGNNDILHPTQKPVALMEYLIRTYTNEGDTVLDFTMGSGTTIVAALNTGRKAIGVEMDESYFRIAQQRIAKAAQMADGQFVTKAGKPDDTDGLPMFGGEQ